MAMACDILIPGYRNDYVTNMRLWKAISSREFDLSEFNEGDYIGAVESKVKSENISKVLYPNDHSPSGKELRLKQQYFFVAATFKDILRRYRTGMRRGSCARKPLPIPITPCCQKPWKCGL
jgi:starch phosphorylase